MNQKAVLWLVVGCFIFFGGWILKDQPYSKGVGQFMMSVGFFIFAVLLAFYILRDVHNDKP